MVAARGDGRAPGAGGRGGGVHLGHGGGGGQGGGGVVGGGGGGLHADSHHARGRRAGVTLSWRWASESWHSITCIKNSKAAT